MPTAPNIVFLMSDQHRQDMTGCYGDPVVRTPAIDALAAQGVRFTHANCQGPICMPARASLLTERYVRDHGVFGNTDAVPLDMPTFLHPLREAGYHTVALGKTHLWEHEGSGDVRDYLPHMERYGWAEVHETVGKLASVRWQSPYRDHLAARGLWDAYRAHTDARNYQNMQHGGSDARAFRMWDATPMPLPLEHYVDAWHGAYAAEWIADYDRDDPFFLFVGFPGPHDPWDAPADAVAMYRDAEIPMPATLKRPTAPDDSAYGLFLGFMAQLCDADTMTPDAIREVRRAYYADITIIDAGIDRIVRALAARGMLDDTWIIYTSDHGEMMGEHSMLSKVLLYEPSVRVPLIVRPPGGTAPRAVDDPVDHIDISATVRAIAGAPGVPGSDARSLLGYLSGEAPEARPVTISENFGFAGFETRRYTLVVDEPGRKPLLLFDRQADPTQDDNRVDDPDAAPIVEELMETYVRPFLAPGLTARRKLPFHAAMEALQ